MVIEGLSLAQNYAHKIVFLAAIEAILATDQDSAMTVVDAKRKIDLWLIDREEQLIEFATAIEQESAYLNFDRYSDSFDLYDDK